MNFIAPLAAAFAALSLPIILLYMLRLRRTELKVSSNFLWRDLVRDREANAPWQKLKLSWLLFLQLLILAALVLALMRPFVEVDTFSVGRIVLLLDASASMNATDVDGNRFEQAQQIALSLAETLGSQDEMSVIQVGAVPQVLANFSNNQSELRAAIHSAQVSQAPADWRAALTLAAAGARGTDDLNIVIISDGGLPGGLPDIPGQLQFVRVGESGENLGISALATRDVPGEGPQLFAQITNYGTQNAETIFGLELDGELFSAQRYSLNAGEQADIIVADLPQTFSSLTASLSQPAAATLPDYLPTDDRAYAVYNPSGAGNVLLVTERNIFLSQIFGSIPGVELTLASPSAGLPVGDFDLYVFDRWLPTNLPDADLFIIDPPRSTPLFTVSDLIEDVNAATVTDVRTDDPLTRFLDFRNVNIRAFKLLTGFESWGQVMLQARGGPLYIAGEVDNRQVAILSFALQDSDLPLQLAWPILITNLVQWYTPPRAIALADSIAPGEAILIRPIRGDGVSIRRPDGEVVALTLGTSAQTIFADTDQLGIYTALIYEGAVLIGEEPFAVNLFDSRESAIAPLDSVTVGRLTLSEASREARGQRELWPYLAALGLAILLIEWLYYHRASLRAKWQAFSARSVQRATAPRSAKRMR